MDLTTNAKLALSRLDTFMLQSNYAGPDPYDGLNSPLARLAIGKIPRQILLQGVKRAPLDVRSMLGIKPVRMSKTMGLVASSLLVAPWLPDAHGRSETMAVELANRSNADGGWGYEFDVQMRWGYYGAGTSNVIATTFVVDALRRITTGETDSWTWKDQVASWISRDLGGCGYISYVKANPALIHNANVLGAMTLYRCNPEDYLIRTALERTLQAQNSDGSWNYGSDKSTSWVDSFHSAYILWGLKELQTLDSSITPALEKGLEFWLEHCFAKGLPKYYAGDQRATSDIHTWATAIFILSRLRHRQDHKALRERLVEDLVARMQGRPFITSRRTGRPYMRWELAHVHRALAEFVSIDHKDGKEPDADEKA